MANLAQALKQEILRLARKEVKVQLAATRKASTRHRREIAELKRVIQGLKRQVAFLEGQEGRRVSAGPLKPAPARARFSARGLKTHRGKLGLSAKDYGRLIGVSHLTIYSWEKGESRPRRGKMGALVEARKLGKREAQRRLKLIR